MSIAQLTSQYILSTSLDYARYVATNRSIPSASDGLKHSQRIALWLLKSRPNKLKVAGLNGAMSESNLYVHGGASGTISLLAAPFLNNVPLITGHGAFGTRVDPYSIGADRYVSVERSKAAEAFLYNDTSIIPMMENYDGSNMQPVTFLPLIPVVLLNGVSGIAVGWSTEILPRAFDDLVKATVEALENKPVTKLRPTYSPINSIGTEIGPNAWEFKGKVEFVDSSSVQVVELPLDMTVEKFQAILDGLEESGIINSYINKSSKKIDFIVKFKRGTVIKENIDSYVDLLKIRTRNTERIVVLDFNQKSIKQYESAEQLVQAFVEWRFTHYIVRYEHVLQEIIYDLLFWKAVILCFEAKLLLKIPGMNSKKEVVEEITNITKTITLDDSQIERIAQIPTYRWTADDEVDAHKKISEIEKNILVYQDLLANPKKIRTIFRDEVKALGKMKF